MEVKSQILLSIQKARKWRINNIESHYMRILRLSNRPIICRVSLRWLKSQIERGCLQECRFQIRI